MGNVAKLQVGPEETNKEIEKTSKEIEETNKETNKEIKETNKEIYSRIIDILEMKLEIAVREIAERLELSIGGVRYHINKMKKAGMIEHVGPTKKGKWVVHK